MGNRASKAAGQSSSGGAAAVDDDATDSRQQLKWASSSVPTRAQLCSLFDSYDLDSSGYLDAAEVQTALTKGGRSVTTAECIALLASVDINHDEKLSFEEFEQVFKLAPDTLPVGVRQLVDVSKLLISGLGAGVAASIGTLASAAGVSSSDAKTSPDETIEIPTSGSQCWTT